MGVLEEAEDESGGESGRRQLAFAKDDLGGFGGLLGKRSEEGLHAVREGAYVKHMKFLLPETSVVTVYGGRTSTLIQAQLLN